MKVLNSILFNIRSVVRLKYYEDSDKHGPVPNSLAEEPVPNPSSHRIGRSGSSLCVCVIGRAHCDSCL